MMTNKIPIIIKIDLYLDVKSWVYPTLPQFSKLACLCAYLPPFVHCQSPRGLCWFFFSVCVGGLIGGPPARKSARGVVAFTRPTANQRRFVTCCEVVSTPARTFEEGGGRASEAIRAPPYLPGTEFLMREVLANARAAWCCHPGIFYHWSNISRQLL